MKRTDDAKVFPPRIAPYAMLIFAFELKINSLCLGENMTALERLIEVYRALPDEALPMVVTHKDLRDSLEAVQHSFDLHRQTVVELFLKAPEIVRWTDLEAIFSDPPAPSQMPQDQPAPQQM